MMDGTCEESAPPPPEAARDFDRSGAASLSRAPYPATLRPVRVSPRRVLLGLMVLAGCSGGESDAPIDASQNAILDAAADAADHSPPPDATGTSPTDAVTTDSLVARDGGPNTCLGAEVLASIGRSAVLVGASMTDEVAKSAPFDLRYLYLSGGFADGEGPCASCATGCTAFAKSCKSPTGCAWWGCWQSDADPPGNYARGYVSRVIADKQIPMITYYQLLQASGVAEGEPQVRVAANDPALMKRYFNDWRFLLQQIGATNVAFLHIEPDFWGYCEQYREDPTTTPAAVAVSNATDCADEPNTITGLGLCLIKMVRKYAPKSKVGLHASSFGTKFPALENRDATFDVVAQAQKLGAFLVAAGAATGDYIVADIFDRDAGYYDTKGRDTWYDVNNLKLPHYKQALTWAKALTEHVGKPLLFWQLPVGNMSLPNTTTKWKDNRVQYFFDHPSELPPAHVLGIAFGAGDGAQTTPSTDDGYLVSRVKAHKASGGQPFCP